MSSSQRFAVTNPLYTFGLTWFGQAVSLLGSGLTSFALGLHIYQQSGSITKFSLASFCNLLPTMLLSPIAGALIDRWDRRRAMLLSDLGAGFGSILVWLLLMAGERGVLSLQPWHFYAPIAMSSAFGAFRFPAYYATTTLLVPKKQLTRANSLVDLAAGTTQIASPVVAAALVLRIGLKGVVLIDLATFGFAVTTLLIVRFPRPPESAAGRAGRGSLRSEMAYGWRFLRERPGLLRLLAFVTVSNLILALVTLLITPLILGFTNVQMLGVILSLAGLGMLAGGIVIGAWGGPKRRVRGILGFHMLAGIALLMAALPPTAPVVAAGAALYLFTNPMLASCSLAIWQSKVPPDLQGRVFAVRRMISLGAPPVAALLCGPLSDKLFEPWMAPGGALADSAGRVLGTGTGRGIALLFVVLGACVFLNVLLAYLSPRLRNVEDELPDAIPDHASRGAVSPAATPNPQSTPALAPDPGASP